MVKQYFNIIVAIFTLAVVTGCDFDEETFEPNYASLQYAPNGANVGVELGGSTSYDVNVYTANVVNTDRTLTINVGSSSTLSPSAYTVPATVTVPAGSNEATFTVEVSDIDLGLTGKTLILSLEQEADISVGDPLRLNVATVCPGKEFVIDFVLDAYPGETGYTLVNAAGQTVVSVDGNPAPSRSLCLPSGTYTFTLTDSYGDGIFDGGVTLSYAGNVLATIDGDFGSETSVEISF
ncbi:hypothetical protein [Christiangramia sp.]|uniref:hypothetical protein n=1 Tax=Christiangramia sp. TaxID=1931228 RepID=UPI00260A67E9|nr:hypothetical protein [Christiangramia sp.]